MSSSPIVCYHVAGISILQQICCQRFAVHLKYMVTSRRVR